MGTPLRSLLLKLGLLATAASLVLWIGWRVEPQSDRGLVGPAELPQSHQPAQSPSDTLSGSGTSAAQPSKEAHPSETRIAKLDLNRATSAQLQALPGIGQALAQRVIDRRVAKGRFDAVDDLLEVKGIGPKRLQQLRPLLTIGSEPTSKPHRPEPQAEKRL